MSNYQVLARKYRPQNFSQVVGQEHVLTAIENGLKTNRLHHAYLFAGTRGVGKTSIARLFAKGLNCLNGVTAEPCGVCANCKAIEEGRFVDLIEIDAASRTKVEDTRELLDNVQYRPTNARFKIYLIDEVHMLSRHSFNALLKTLEEPPEYVKFLLATTDPHKLPITILSRCMQFNLKALQPEQICQNLQNILTQEQISFELPALESIAQSAHGSIRDSLSLTDQAIALGSGEVSFAVVKNMLGLIDSDYALNVLRALQQANGEQLMATLQGVAEQGGNWLALIDDLLAQLHKLALLQFLPQTQNSNSPLTLLAQQIPPQDIQFLFQVIQQGRKELESSPNLRISVEMLLLRALAFHPKFLNLEPAKTPSSLSSPSVTPAPTVTSSNALATNTGIGRLKAQLNNSNSNQDTTQAQAKISNNPSNSGKIFPNSEGVNADSTLETLANIQAVQELVQEKKSLAKSTETSQAPVNLSSLTTKPETKPNKLQTQLQNQLQAPTQAKSETISEAQTSNTPAEPTSAEPAEYSWQWLNPELSDANSASNVKTMQATTEQKFTPQLKQRILELVCEQDPWSNIIHSLNLQSFLRDMALNSVLLSQDNEQFNVGLRSSLAHLQVKYTTVLQKALSEHFNANIQLKIQLTDDPNLMTPNEWENKIYQQLCHEAHEALAEDPKLALLIQEFQGELEQSSVRPL